MNDQESGDESGLPAVERHIKSELDDAKQRFDSAWNNDPSEALPLIRELEDAIDRYREFLTIRRDTEELVRLHGELEELHRVLTDGLSRFEETFQQLETIHPGMPSRDLCAIIDRFDPTKRIVAALRFVPSEDSKLLLDMVKCLRDFRHDLSRRSVAAEKGNQRHRERNEIGFDELFDTDLDDEGNRVVTVIPEE